MSKTGSDNNEPGFESEETFLGQPLSVPVVPDRPGGGELGMLLVLVGPNAGQTFPVNERITIGRATECTLAIGSNDVSREHAEIVARGKDCVLRDLGSRNGSWINGVRVDEQTLRFGDKIRIGSSTILLYSPYDELEEQLLQTQRLVTIGELAGQFAHDFRNLIAAIRVNLDFLRSLAPERLAEKDAQDALADSDAAVGRATELTEQVLGLARRRRPEYVATDVTLVINEVLRLIERSFPSTIALRPTFPGRDPGSAKPAELYVTADPSQLHQVVMNLCVNARDAMPEGGTLWVTANVVDRAALSLEPDVGSETYVLISVADSGCGMSDALQREIFQPFFTTKKKGQGTGLGLSTCASIVRQMGGFIRVDSKQGEGSQFNVYIPSRKPPPAVLRPESPTKAKTRKLSEGIVLLVDDDDVFRRSARRLLESMGYLVNDVAGGREAVALLEKLGTAISLVLLDMAMPTMDGSSTFKALRALRDDVAVIICSADGESPAVQTLLKAGARGFLPKPFDTESLAHSLSKAIF